MADSKNRHPSGYPDVEDLTTAELSAWHARSDEVQPILLNARAAAEFAVSHLAGAVHASTLDDAVTALAGAALDTPVSLTARWGTAQRISPTDWASAATHGCTTWRDRCSSGLTKGGRWWMLTGVSTSSTRTGNRGLTCSTKLVAGRIPQLRHGKADLRKEHVCHC